MLSSAGRLRRPEHVRPLRTLAGHTDTVRCVAFFPDNRRIVSSSWDNSVRIWDVETGLQTRAPFTGHTDVVRSVAVSPDGEKIASVAEDRTLRVWSVSSGELVYEPVEGHASGLWCVTFSPDGRRIATTGDNTIRVWNADTGDLVAGPFRSHNGNLYALTFSPDGLEIASVANDKTVCICDADIGQMLLGPMEGHDSDVRCVVYSPNGRQLVTAADDGTIRVWDVITGEQVGEPMKSHANIITSIAISPDSTFLATAGPHIVMQVWNLDTRQVAGPPLRHANDVSCVAFSADGRYLVGGCCDFRIWLWDADVIRRPCPDAPPPLPKVEPAPLVSCSPGHTTVLTNSKPITDSKPEDNTVRTVSPALIPLPPSPNSLLGSILEVSRMVHLHSSHPYPKMTASEIPPSTVLASRERQTGASSSDGSSPCSAQPYHRQGPLEETEEACRGIGCAHTRNKALERSLAASCTGKFVRVTLRIPFDRPLCTGTND